MPQLKANKQAEAKLRNEAYQQLTIDQKIEKQTKAGHNGKQLKKLLKLKVELDSKKEKKDVD